jgi:dipeptidyl aminopeptidase/acylaminoacyl peptidase
MVAVGLVVCGSAAGGGFPGRDGLVVFSRSTGDQQAALVSVDPATGSEHTLGAGTAPAWSPDGSKLAFVRDGTVYLAAADGSDATAVGPGTSAGWSPDGSRLVLSRYDGIAQAGKAQGTLQLVVVTLSDGTETQITEGTTDALLPAWSPDGSTIAFTTPTALETIPADGGTPTPLALPGVKTNGGVSWSPNGRSLAFLDSGGQVWTAAADGSGARQITYTLVGPNSSAERPAWSPDGSTIAWTAGADLCVTDLAGYVRRVTRNAQTSARVLASLPDWQPTGGGSGAIYVAPPGANDSIGCDWNPGVRVEMVDRNVSPSIFSVRSTQQLVFVNHLLRPLSVSTTMLGDHATVDPGRFVSFKTVPGTYDFTVAGYPDGVPRSGTFAVLASGSVAIDQHTALRYGASAVLTGSAGGSATGKVTVMSQPSGASSPKTIASLTPSGGHWRLPIAPKVTTLYRVLFGDATAERTIRVMPDLRVSRRGGTISATLRPGAALAGSTLYLFRLAADGWTQARSARTNGAGAATFRNVSRGRYYVGFPGRGAWWATAGDPFPVGS